MDHINISKFIDKTIARTNNKSLNWKMMSPSTPLKPLPEEKGRIPLLSPEKLAKEYSFIAPFQTGYILLLTFQPTGMTGLLEPPDGCTLSLRVQDEKSRYSTEISNSRTDPHNASSLIRLYNLIDKDDSSLSTLIDNFLNS